MFALYPITTIVIFVVVVVAFLMRLNASFVLNICSMTTQKQASCIVLSLQFFYLYSIFKSFNAYVPEEIKSERISQSLATAHSRNIICMVSVIYFL